MKEDEEDKSKSERWKTLTSKPQRDNVSVELIEEDLPDAIPIITPYFEDFAQVDNKTTSTEK